MIPHNLEKKYYIFQLISLCHINLYILIYSKLFVIFLIIIPAIKTFDSEKVIKGKPCKKIIKKNKEII